MIERSTTRTRNRRTRCDRKAPTGSPAFRFPIIIGFVFVFGVGVGVAATPWVEALVVRPQSHRTPSSPGLGLQYLSHTQIPVPPVAVAVAVAVADDPQCETTATATATAAATARFRTTPKAMLLAMLAWTLAATPVSASAPAFAVATGVPEDNNPAPAQLHLAEKVSTTRGGHGNGNGNRDVHAPSSLLLLSSSPSSSSSLSSLSLSLSLESASSSPYTGTPYTGELMDVSRTSLVALESGVTYRDLRAGTGTDAVTEGNRVNIQWVLKRSNGYTIDASANHDGVPFIFVVGGGGGGEGTSSSSSNNSNSNSNSNNNSGKRGGSGSASASANVRAIAGLDEGIRGMTIGGIRRIVIPPSLAYVDGLDEKDPGPVPPGFGPKQRIRRVMENRIDVPDESFLLDVKLTRIQ